MRLLVTSLITALLFGSPLASQVDVIVFDFGGVIATTDRSIVIDFIARSLDTSEPAAKKILQEWFDQIESGQMGRAAFEAAVNSTMSLPPGWTAQLELVMQRAIEPIPGMLHLVGKLKESGYQTAILSNTVPMRAEAIRRKGFYEPFAPVVLSCEIGHAKPDLMAYKIFLEALGKPARTCLFIDDKPINTQAAEEAGMKAIHFSSTGQLRSDLEGRGILQAKP